MLRNKDIAKIQEVKALFKDSWIQADFFCNYLELFNFHKTSKVFKSVKKSGVPFWDLMKLILTLPFLDKSTVGSVFSSNASIDVKAKKDTYYRTLSNQKMDWRNLLFLFVKRYLSISLKLNSPIKGCKCLIFDDTTIPKRGKKIEGLSKVYDHVSHRFIFGFKLLVAGYWDGSVFIPLDFSFHRENKDNKQNKYGLKNKQRKQQKKTKRNSQLPVKKRYEELNSKKSSVVISMFKRICRRKIEVEYILFDSWFTNMSLIKEILKINKKVHVIGMYKYNSKLTINEKEFSIKQLRKTQSKMKRSRSLKLYFYEYVGKLDGIEVKVFISKRGTNGAWHTIISTNTKLSFSKTMAIYSHRWTIEVFFKEAKQLLGLGKCQSTNFDVQVAQTTITMIRYLLISLKYRIQAYETIGGIFRNVKQEYIEYKLNQRIMSVIVEILEILDFLIEDLDINSLAKKMILNSESLSLLTKPHYIENEHKLAA
jgi:hypothetical protein